ncbi:hypothetical protein [Paenibacillus kandeliae]|uniref:hypothetical protein n=1 Tax=Paenibacillus kandeliae TaxID=3231269 RepID=UPI00345A7754
MADAVSTFFGCVEMAVDDGLQIVMVAANQGLLLYGHPSGTMKGSVGFVVLSEQGWSRSYTP